MDLIQLQSGALPSPNSKKFKSGKVRENIFICCMLAYPLIQFFIFWFLVNVGSIGMMFQRYDIFTGENVFYGLGNFTRLFKELTTDAEVQRTILNSLMYMPVTCFISLPLSILFSYFLYKKMPLAPVFRVIFFLPSIMPIVVLTMSFKFTFDARLGPIDKILELIGFKNTPNWFGAYPTSQIMVFVYCIWAGLGFNILLLSGAIGRIPEEVMEYGRLEGVGMSRELLTIVCPLIWPTITTTFLLGCTSVFTVMLQPMLLTANDNNTQTIALMIFNGVNRQNDVRLPYLTTFGLTLSILAMPIIMLIRWVLGKIYADVEY